MAAAGRRRAPEWGRLAATRAGRTGLVAAGAILLIMTLGLTVAAGWSFTRSPDRDGAPPAVLQNVPALGTDAIDLGDLRSTLTDMGRTSLSWNVSYMSDDEPLDLDLLDGAAALGVRHLVVTIEFWSLEGHSHVLRQIADGAVDGHLRTIAGEMQAWRGRHPGSEIIVRPLHEANLPTYPWGFGAGNGNENALQDFAPAWDRIWRVMREASPGLKFLFCPNGGDESSYDWGVPAAQVDYVGHDLYNRSEQFGGWISPGALHTDTVLAIRSLYPDKPYVIAETGTSEPGAGVTGHSKAQWFRELAAWMKDSGAGLGLVVVCYFNHDTRGEDHNDWRIHPVGRSGADESRRAFREAFARFP